jgi:hypothetical protein
VIPGYSLLLVCFLPLQVHTRPRVPRASGVPHALCLKEGQGSCTTRAHRAAGSRAHVFRSLKIESDVRNGASAAGQDRRRDGRRPHLRICRGLRAVTSTDGMTADFYSFDMKFLGETATRIINEVKGVNRVVYDITSKPPGTIEWE